MTENDLVAAVYAHHEDTEERPHVEEQYASLVREEDLTKSFITALLLVGNVCDAEAAVCNAIDSMDPDQPSVESLIRLTVVAATRSAEVESGVGDYSLAIPLLPLEFRRLMSLGRRPPQVFRLAHSTRGPSSGVRAPIAHQCVTSGRACLCGGATVGPSKCVRTCSDWLRSWPRLPLALPPENENLVLSFEPSKERRTSECERL